MGNCIGKQKLDTVDQLVNISTLLLEHNNIDVPDDIEQVVHESIDIVGNIG